MNWFETVCPCPGSPQDGFTPLEVACSKGYLEVVQSLLSAGADREAADKAGITLLLCSSFNTLVCTYVLVLKYAHVPDLLRTV